MKDKLTQKALIIGAAGFVGGHLIHELMTNTDWEITASKLSDEVIDESKINVIDLDILDYQAINNTLSMLKPDFIFHLAAQSSVSFSWKKPQMTVDINVKGTINILESIKKLELQSRVLLIGSSEEYGEVNTNDNPVSESHTTKPLNIYSATKHMQNILGNIYYRAYHMDILMVRAFNHIGPGQSDQFVVSDFCKQIAEIKLNKRESRILVGNLSAERDFTDVRDIVRGYRMLMLYGESGKTYNIGQGKAISISDLLNCIIKLSNIDIQVEVDLNKFRPVDTPKIESNIELIKKDIGWVPEISLEESILSILEYWIINIQKGA